MLTRALSESTRQMPHDISERLRTAREAALRVQKPETAQAWTQSGQTALLQGPGAGPKWTRWAVWLPLLVLACGIYLIQLAHQQSQVSAAADVDAILLADDLPPDAYSDAGFLEFLKLPTP
jgi:Protein of unknown function (DUF3619)